MRIIIDARQIADHFPGIARYSFNLIRALAQLGSRHELIALTCPGLLNTRYPLEEMGVQLVSTRIRPFTVAEQLALPQLLRALKADLYHAPYYVRPYLGLPCRSLTTLFDIIPRRFPESYSPQARLLFDLFHHLAVRLSERIIVASSSNRSDLIDAYGLRPDRVNITPLAADPGFRPQDASAIGELRARLNLPECYVLSLASNKPHKNIEGLLRAWKVVVQSHGAENQEPAEDPRPKTQDPRTKNQEPLSEGGTTEPQNHRTSEIPRTKNQEPRTKNQEPLSEASSQMSKPLPFDGARSSGQQPPATSHQPPALIIAGHRDLRAPDPQRQAAAHGLADTVRYLPDVPERDLPALYAGATLFVLPSLYEGFGLPVLEAMACGAPVVCGDRSSLPEVVGDAALLTDVADPQALAQTLMRALGDASLLEEMRAHGIAQAARFSWRRTAELTLAAYECTSRS